jgi:hypothetical protein
VAVKEKEIVPINFATINDGALIEAFEIELQKVLVNIADANTPATATRSLTLQLVLKPHADRVVILSEVHCKSSLAPIEKHEAKIYLGKSTEGDLVAFDGDPRQMSLWTSPKVAKQEPIEFNKSS